MRKIGLHPLSEYEFTPHTEHRQKWAFLNEKANVVMWQLQYLEFHGWLKQNLKQCDKRRETIQGHGKGLLHWVSEGFYRTDILLFAAICEAALFWVLKKEWEKGSPKACQHLSQCFEAENFKYHSLNKNKFSMLKADGTNIEGKLYLQEIGQPRKFGDTEIKFKNLIKGGKDYGIYKDSLFQKLESLMKQRNTIHLAKHEAYPDVLAETHRHDAESTTEKLRATLESFSATAGSTT